MSPGDLDGIAHNAQAQVVLGRVGSHIEPTAVVVDQQYGAVLILHERQFQNVGRSCFTVLVRTPLATR